MACAEQASLVNLDHFLPTASAIHFFIWLSRAAPDSFFAFLSASHDAAASSSHFFMKLVKAAPASFFSVALSVQDGSASALPQHAKAHIATARLLISRLHREALSFAH